MYISQDPRLHFIVSVPVLKGNKVKSIKQSNNMFAMFMFMRWDNSPTNKNNSIKKPLE